MGEFYETMLLMEHDDGWLGADPSGIADRVIDAVKTQHPFLSEREMVAKITYLTKAVRGGYISREAQRKLRKLVGVLKLHHDPEVWTAVKGLEMTMGVSA